MDNPERKRTVLMHPHGKCDDYSSRYDITIHCANKAEYDETILMIRKATVLMARGML